MKLLFSHAVTEYSKETLKNFANLYRQSNYMEPDASIASLDISRI